MEAGSSQGPVLNMAGLVFLSGVCLSILLTQSRILWHCQMPFCLRRNMAVGSYYVPIIPFQQFMKTFVHIPHLPLCQLKLGCDACWKSALELQRFQSLLWGSADNADDLPLPWTMNRLCVSHRGVIFTLQCGMEASMFAYYILPPPPFWHLLCLYSLHNRYYHLSLSILNFLTIAVFPAANRIPERWLVQLIVKRVWTVDCMNLISCDEVFDFSSSKTWWFFKMAFVLPSKQLVQELSQEVRSWTFTMGFSIDLANDTMFHL